MHPEDRRPVRALTHLEKNAGADLDKDSEYRIIRPSDVEVRVITSRCGVIYGEDGRPTQYYGATQDITERKKFEEDLAHVQALAKVGNFSWDLRTGEVQFSDEVRRIYGVDSNTNPGSVMLQRIHPKDRNKLTKAIEHAKSEENSLQKVECRLLLKDGTERFVHINGTTIFNENGQPTTIFGTVQDITERKKTEEVIHRSEKLAVVGELAAGVAHEIRNPLATLKGFLQLMNSTDTSREKQRQYFDVMLDELARIEFITSELLSLARPQVSETGHRNIISKLNEVVGLLESEALLHNVSIILDLPPEEIIIDSEAGKIKQVFVNIIKNAIDAMPDGGVLNIRVMQKDQRVTVQFSDSGCGIPEERLSRIGELFYTTKEKGTGLGLTVSNKILQNHGGTLEVQSVVGKGTAVTVTLPIVTE